MSKCEICGTTIVTEKRTYKPRQYCNSNCRDYFKYKNALEKVLLTIKPDKEHLSVIRGDMFRLANLFNNCTNTKIRQ